MLYDSSSCCHVLSKHSQPSYEEDATVPIFQVSKLNLRVAQSHPAADW